MKFLGSSVVLFKPVQPAIAQPHPTREMQELKVPPVQEMKLST